MISFLYDLVGGSVALGFEPRAATHCMAPPFLLDTTDVLIKVEIVSPFLGPSIRPRNVLDLQAEFKFIRVSRSAIWASYLEAHESPLISGEIGFEDHPPFIETLDPQILVHLWPPASGHMFGHDLSAGG